MDREHILSEIRRTAAANGGVSLGFRRFQTETGISTYDYKEFWARWSDAVRDAGFEPDQPFSEQYDDRHLIEILIQLTRTLNLAPNWTDLEFATRNDAALPSIYPFRRLGSMSRWASQLLLYCESHSGNEDVAKLWRAAGHNPEKFCASDRDCTGFVYLVKHGARREYKIGRTINPLRREGEIGVQLPEKLRPVHYIETDDPAGVESYWHRRFAEKRKEGEWFELSAADVRAFKRWKRIY